MLVDLDGRVLFSGPLRMGSDLSELDLRRADLRNLDVDGLTLTGSDLRGADFSNCDLYWVSMYVANCSDACFRNARFEGASFKSACLKRADFSFAVIINDRLGGASTLVHANLEGAKLDGANLVGTQYDAATVFPLGFNPVAHGMILVAGDLNATLVEPPCMDV